MKVNATIALIAALLTPVANAVYKDSHPIERRTPPLGQDWGCGVNQQIIQDLTTGEIICPADTDKDGMNKDDRKYR